MAAYMIQGGTMTGIADQVRRLAETNALLTPDEMAVTLQGIEAGGALPVAEEYSFGNAKDVSEYAVTGVANLQWGNANTYYVGWKFEVLSEISIKGFRMMNGSMSSKSSFEPQLYRVSDSALIASATVTCAKSATVDVMLDEPVALTVGETYAVLVINNNLPWQYWGNVTVNSKIKKITGIAAATAENPTIEEVLASADDSLYGVIIPIIGEPVDNTVIPTEYQIQLDTMNDIAVEAQRLSGAGDQITTAQIITALQNTEVAPFPAFPTEIIINCPYRVLMKYEDESSSSTWAYGSKTKPYFSTRTDGDSMELPSGRYRAMLNETTNEWMAVGISTNATKCNLSTNWSVVWTDFNMPNGSASATAIYHAAGSFMPAL